MGFRIEKNAEPIPGYRLLEPLGRGGFGEVWKCEAPGRLLKAIKFVFGNLEDQGDRRRTDQELRSLTRVRAIRHPFLLSLERYDIVEGQLAIVMELADRDLMHRFRECRKRGLPGIPRPELLRYLEEAAEVLDVMNQEHDLQHLDVKPQNFLLLHNHVKVADFGLVKDLTGLVASVTGGLTPKYAPPETFNGMVSRFSDQYSLALVYHELLTGRGPYAFGNLQEIMLQHTEGAPDLSALPEKEQAVIARALAKDPDRRHPCCRALLEALRRVEDSPTVPAAAPEPPRFAEQLTAEHTPTPPPERFADTSFTPSGIALPSCHEVGPPSLLTEPDDEGVLVPALVVGLGGFGLDVLRRFRKGARARFGDPRGLPSLRLLGIDTDPQTLTQAQQAPAAEALDREELLPARLARSSRYLRPRDPLPPLDDWLPPRILHRITRYQGTSGYRALGRLAFVDNYRTIVATLRRQLEKVAAPEALAATAEESGLPPRTGKPRVYVVASLAGGTGSGMLVDLAYVVRGLLRELGPGRAEVYGLLLLPPGAQRPDTVLPRANGYAALAELSHFANPNATFQALHDSQAPALADVSAPFDRCYLLNPPGQAGGGDPVRAAADYLYLHLLTPLGREADTARRTCPDPRAADGPLPLQMFGVDIRFSPARRLLRQGARRLAQTLLEQWTRGNPPNAGQVRQEVQARLHDLKLDTPNQLEMLQKSCARTLGVRPEQIFLRWLDAVSGPAARFDPRHVARVLRQADEFFGHPDANVGLQVPPAVAALRQAAEEAGELARGVLGQMVIAYLERPGPRLGLAVEALKQASAQVERWVQVQDKQLEQISARVQQSRRRLEAGALAAERGALAGDDARRGRDELHPLLMDYPAACYQQQLAVALRGVYLGMRGYLSDQVREVAFYRQPLDFLHQALTEAEAAAAQDPAGPGLLAPGAFGPSGETLLAAEDFLELDRAVQQALREHPDAQCAVWEVTGSDRGVKILGDILVRQAERLLRRRLPGHDAAELFLAQAPEAELAQRLRQGFAAAGPLPLDVPRGAAPELALAMAPSSPAGARLLEAARGVQPELRPILSDCSEEIVFYREALGLGLGELEQLGLLDREAYRHICAREQDAAHARVDILPRGQTAAGSR